MLASALVYGDETVVQLLKEKGKAAQSNSYMWAQMTQASGADGTGPPIRLFAYSPSRSTQAAQLLYAGILKGSALMTDGFGPYNAIATTHQHVLNLLLPYLEPGQRAHLQALVGAYSNGQTA